MGHWLSLTSGGLGNVPRVTSPKKCEIGDIWGHRFRIGNESPGEARVAASCGHFQRAASVGTLPAQLRLWFDMDGLMIDSERIYWDAGRYIALT
jgi:hypothetical protein